MESHLVSPVWPSWGHFGGGEARRGHPPSCPNGVSLTGPSEVSTPPEQERVRATGGAEVARGRTSTSGLPCNSGSTGLPQSSPARLRRSGCREYGYSVCFMDPLERAQITPAPGTSTRRSTGWSRSDRGHHQQINVSGAVVGPAHDGRETERGCLPGVKPVPAWLQRCARPYPARGCDSHSHADERALIPPLLFGRTRSTARLSVQIVRQMAFAKV